LFEGVTQGYGHMSHWLSFKVRMVVESKTSGAEIFKTQKAANKINVRH
tara:strand:+ start:254 stop:397 length:144 start_codon:yes stop_codon:yes gene_type:complete